MIADFARAFAVDSSNNPTFVSFPALPIGSKILGVTFIARSNVATEADHLFLGLRMASAAVSSQAEFDSAKLLMRDQVFIAETQIDAAGVFRATGIYLPFKWRSEPPFVVPCFRVSSSGDEDCQGSLILDVE